MESREIKMRQVWITDAEVITAFGDTLDALWQGLMEGRTAVKPVTRFGSGAYNAACIDDLESSGTQSMMHHLLDRLFGKTGPVPEDSLIITATTKSGIDNLELLCRGVTADSKDVLLSSLPKKRKAKTIRLSRQVLRATLLFF